MVFQGKDTRDLEGECEAIYQFRAINQGRDIDFFCCWLEMVSYKQMKPEILIEKEITNFIEIEKYLYIEPQ